MLVKMKVPADVPEGRALRLLELCATQLWGDGPWLERYEIPREAPAAPFSPKSETSRRAASLHAPQAGSEARDVLSILWHARAPMNAARITGVMQSGEWPKITRNQVAARLWALHAGGWVEYVHHEELHGPGEFTTDHDGFVVEKTSEHGRHYGRVHKLSVKAIRMFTTTEAQP